MREEFERWYLQVVKGHPNNLTKDESGGYKYLAAMYLGWEAATLIEREKCAQLCEEVVTHPAGHGGQWEGYGAVKTQRDGTACAAAIRMRSNLK